MILYKLRVEYCIIDETSENFWCIIRCIQDSLYELNDSLVINFLLRLTSKDGAKNVTFAKTNKNQKLQLRNSCYATTKTHFKKIALDIFDSLPQRIDLLSRKVFVCFLLKTLLMREFKQLLQSCQKNASFEKQTTHKHFLTTKSYAWGTFEFYIPLFIGYLLDSFSNDLIYVNIVICQYLYQIYL